MSSTDAKTADVIIIGGGVAGLSAAVQLGARGQKVLLLERSVLGSGSSGRAAGLLGQLRSTRAATAMLMDGVEIVKVLEEKAGVEIFVQTGSVRVAQNPERAAEVREHVAMGKSIGFDIEFIDRERCRELLPYMRVDDLTEICYCPTDGYLQPAELVAAYARVARQSGAALKTQCPIEGIVVKNSKVTGVRACGEEYSSPVVVNAGGPWSHLVAGLANTNLPTAALGHYYLTTRPDPSNEVSRTSPGVRDRENRIYSRPDVGGLIVGMYEADPDTYRMEDLPSDFDMSAMPVARDNLNVAILIDATRKRFPFINERLPMHVTTGIMTFTPDGKPFCGALPDVEGLYHCSGFCGHGIVQSPVIGVIMADLILHGSTKYDIKEIEADRYFDMPEFEDRRLVLERCIQTYASHYGKVATADR